MAPPEYDPSAVAAASTPDRQLPYAAHVRSGMPYRALAKRDFHIGAREGLGVFGSDARARAAGPVPGLDLEDPQLYYNTGPGSLSAEYWKGKELPRPTRDLAKLRADLVQWGYCLVAEVFSPKQLEAVRDRVYAQADGERKAGVAHFSAGAPPPGKKLPPVQLVHSLLNKGELFRHVFEMEPEAIQGGPAIEQILREALGDDFVVSTYLSLITDKYNLPQNLHQDQSSAPFQTEAGPMSLNVLIFLDEFTQLNGGTLVIPGSHRIVSRSPELDAPLPPPVNATGPAGTALIFEGRLLHGAGVNRTDRRRAALILDSRMHFLRQQELFVVSLAPDVVDKMSPKSLARLGFRPRGMGGAEGTFNEFQLAHKQALVEGNYKPVRELSPDSPAEVLAADYTVRHTETATRQAPHQEDAIPAVKERFAGLEPVLPRGPIAKNVGLMGEKIELKL
ncbi:hypothetical protein DFJ74DRAFT_687477 [Hyaloraphidium curvatum]|nr:hypothetical protein DFJ74DRAFT_687477 [Hyaloraphidium curvatum]